MRKTIFSLTALATLLVGVPVYASPVVDSETAVVATSESVVSEPTVNVIYQSDLELSHTPSSYWDARFVKGKEKRGPNPSLKPNEKKITHYIRLSRGQKLDVDISWYNEILHKGRPNRGIIPTLPKKEVQIEQDGYYLTEFVAPPSSSVSRYTLFTESTVYEKR